LSMVTVLVLIKWQKAMIALGVIPPLFILTRLSSKRLNKNWTKVKEDESLAMSVVHEVLSALRIVKAFGQENSENKRFIDQSGRAVKGQMRVAWTGAGFQFLISMVFATGSALFIFNGAHYVKSGEMTLGELTMVIAYLGMVFGPLESISKNLNNTQSSVTSLKRVFALLDHETEVKETANSVHLARAKGAIQFQNVSFCYNSKRPVLNNITFKIKAGERVGVMGSTGAGKSTLISLLMRFYDTTNGLISIDGTDIKNFKLADYRNQFSVVLQEPVLFSTTIKENICYGKPEATEKEIIEAAKAANAHDFIMRCVNGYDSLVGERGMQLSGGERQRISIARAFIKNAPVLILDEPTSSVDIKTEAQIMDAMERLMEGRTTFMITHRLDTLNSCNVILHLEQGELIEVVRDHDLNYIAEKKASFLNTIG
jgi:ATP-binding cassette, subfamily B, bacterial